MLFSLSHFIKVLKLSYEQEKINQLRFDPSKYEDKGQGSNSPSSSLWSVSGSMHSATEHGVGKGNFVCSRLLSSFMYIYVIWLFNTTYASI